MSYDVHIDLDGRYVEPYFDDRHPGIGSDCHAGNVHVTASGYARCGNYTSNVSGMWSRCLTAAVERVPDADAWKGDDARRMIREHPTATYYTEHLEAFEQNLTLRDLAGKTGAELAPLLAAAVEWGVEHLAELHEDDPANGWGDADGAVTFLWDIQRICEQHPTGRLEISS